MATKTNIQIHPDCLLEWNYDDTNILSNDYVIVNDSLNNINSFCFDTTATDSNDISNQLFLIDGVTNSFGTVSTTRSFIQYQKYAKPANTVFDRIRLYFPINYVFPNTNGVYISIKAYDYDNSIFYGLCNMYIDITNPTLFDEIQLNTPFSFGQRLWGKYIEFNVPSVYTEAQNRSGVPSLPIPGTINYNLTGGNRGRGLSQTQPIFIDFRFIITEDIVVGNTVYTLTPSNVASVPQAPAFQTLGVSIQPNTGVDNYVINGTFNGTSTGFLDYMTLQENTGNRSYVTYSIAVYEENVLTDTPQYYVTDNFDTPIYYRPTFLFTSTTASIAVTMNVVNTVDLSVSVLTAEYGLLPAEVSKYGKQLMSINVSNAIAPIIYNAQPDNVVITASALTALARRTVPQNTNVQYTSIPVMVESTNVVVSDVTLSSNNTTYFGQDLYQLVLHPLDNLFKVHIAQQVNGAFTPITIPASNATVSLTFISSTNTITLSLYTATGEVDYTNAVFVFLIQATDVANIAKMTDTNRFYIVLNSNGLNTTIYAGTFILSNSAKYISTIQTNQSNNVVTIPPTTIGTFSGVSNSGVINATLSGSQLTVPASNTLPNAQLTISDATVLGFSPTQYKLIL